MQNEWEIRTLSWKATCTHEQKPFVSIRSFQSRTTRSAKATRIRRGAIGAKFSQGRTLISPLGVVGTLKSNPLCGLMRGWLLSRPQRQHGRSSLIRSLGCLADQHLLTNSAIMLSAAPHAAREQRVERERERERYSRGWVGHREATSRVNP